MNILYLAGLILYLPPLLYALVKIVSFLLWIADFVIGVPVKLLGGRGSKDWLQKLKEKSKPATGKINFGIGLVEYYVRPLRNYLLGTAFIVILIIFLLPVYKGNLASADLRGIGLLLLFVFLTFLSNHRQTMASLKMTEFLRISPEMDPTSYFHNYYRLLGPFRVTLPDPETLPVVSPEKVDFKRHIRSEQSLSILLPALWDTAHLAHACLRALKMVGKEYARDVFDIHASMWGKRLLQLFHAGLEVTGTERLKNLKGKILLIFNHKSELDFGLTFFALSSIHLARGRKVFPRFITAKDHFVDNLFVYELVGIGKLIEAVDMVFIERKKKGKGMQNLAQAAEFLSRKEIEIAIFPQGTRAEGNIDRSGKRRDAGYYTTITPKSLHSDTGHLKKGTSFLAVDTLLELAQGSREDLHLVFVGIRGTATTMSKQSMKVQTESDIQYVIGEPLTLSPDLVEGLKKPEGAEANQPEEQRYLDLVSQLHQKIDERLSVCSGIHENLYHRFMVDLQGNFRFSRDRMELIQKNFDHVCRESSILYQILDRIYACPMCDWNSYLSEFAHLLMEEASYQRLQEMREQISLKMLEALKTRGHGKKVKKKMLKTPVAQNG